MKKKYLSLAAFIILLSTSVNLNAANTTSVPIDVCSSYSIESVAPSLVNPIKLAEKVARAEIKAIVEEKVNKDPYDYGYDIKLIEFFGFDSLDCFEMAMEIDEDLDLGLSDDEFQDLIIKLSESTLGQFTEYLRNLILIK